MAVAPPSKVAVIGAGFSGLAAARALKSEGLQVIVYEKSDQLGGVWVYDPRVESDPLSQDPNREIVHSSLYSSLRTNTPRQLMGFMDYPFGKLKVGDSGRTFPGHEEVLQYAKEFAEDFGLMELIRFGCEVIRVDRVGSRIDEWVVEWRNGDRIFQEVFDAVVVCSGHFTKPRIANFPGIENWPGEQLHSHNYRSPERFHNKVVIVIGLGTSGWDIAHEISVVAKEVHVSARDDTRVDTFFKLRNIDNLRRHSEIDCVHANGEVTFRDGSSVVADVMIHSTGYEYYYPFLKVNGIVTVEDNRVGPLYKHVFPPQLAPRLSFVGIPEMTITFLVMEFQAKWISQVLSGKKSLPPEEEMTVEINEFYRNLEDKGKSIRHTHRIGLEASFEYLDSIAVAAGLSKPGEEIRGISDNYLAFVIKHGYLRTREWNHANIHFKS